MNRILIAAPIAILAITTYAFIVGKPPETVKPDLTTPSPALGKVVANAVHQALTDPYFTPLEKLASWMESHPGGQGISVDLLTKWAPDDEIPTCFVWNTDGSKLQVDHPFDPSALEILISRLKEGISRPNPDQLLYIATFRVNGDRNWLGFVALPAGSTSPTQVAGSFFSLKEYLDRSIPRILNEMTSRPRFPLVEFQSTTPPFSGEREGDISFRILDKQGEVYYQQGRNFEPETMLYAESQFYPKPIVALQEGWDLQVFSTRMRPAEQAGLSKVMLWGLTGALILLIVGLIYWVGGQREILYRTPPIIR